MLSLSNYSMSIATIRIVLFLIAFISYTMKMESSGVSKDNLVLKSVISDP